MSRPSASERIPIVDAVRFVSLLVVLAVHLATTGITVLPASTTLSALWLGFARNGSYGVSMFFVVSGFVITRTILRRQPDLARLDLRGFYVRRAGRILPLFLLVTGIGALALWALPLDSARAIFCLRDPSARLDAGFWASLFTFSFNWLRIAREATTYGFGMHWDVMWSLAIEEQFYLGYPLLLRVLGARARVTAALVGFVVLGPVWRAWARAQAPDSFLLGFTASPACFDLLAIGALLCLALDGRERSALRGGARLAETLVGLAGLVGVVWTYHVTALTSADDRVWGPSALGLSVAALLAVGIRQNWLSSRLTAALTVPGQYTYSGYLAHAAVLYALWPKFSGQPALAAFAVYTAVVFAVAAALYKFFELPTNEAIRARLRG